MRSNPYEELDKLKPKQRIVLEIERGLSIEEDLELEFPRKNASKDFTPRIANRDLYKIYKRLCELKDVDPYLIYTGNSILEDWEDREDLDGESIEDFEPSL